MCPTCLGRPMLSRCGAHKCPSIRPHWQARWRSLTSLYADMLPPQTSACNLSDLKFWHGSRRLAVVSQSLHRARTSPQRCVASQSTLIARRRVWRLGVRRRNNSQWCSERVLTSCLAPTAGLLKTALATKASSAQPPSLEDQALRLCRQAL